MQSQIGTLVNSLVHPTNDPLMATENDTILKVPVLNGCGSSGDHLISVDGGAAGGTPIMAAGVLTAPDSQSPVDLDVGNGSSIISASALPNTDLSQPLDNNGALPAL